MAGVTFLSQSANWHNKNKHVSTEEEDGKYPNPNPSAMSSSAKSVCDDGQVINITVLNPLIRSFTDLGC